jgi:hypothetical protein
MKILDRLPYFSEHRALSVRGEAVQVRPYQIVVWVSVNIARLREWDSRTPAFPAILNPGNNFNFSIFHRPADGVVEEESRGKPVFHRQPRHNIKVAIGAYNSGIPHADRNGRNLNIDLADEPAEPA